MARQLAADGFPAPAAMLTEAVVVFPEKFW